MLCARQIDFLLCQRTWFAASLLWLNGVPASHTGVRQILPSCLRGFPNWDCWQNSGWLHGNHEPSLDIPCVRLPRGALLSTEKCSPEQKQNQTQARVGGEEPSALGGRGCSRAAGLAHRCGEELGWAALSATWPAGLQPREHLDFCPKLVRNKESLLAVGGRRHFWNQWQYH